ncbi:fimbrillin family protein [uncultured Bacteroides sp.]|uniref:fimbrillin family protein n=1 Tax=uncultured Bacteroides sp. TaxID=162156 RepID=UPI00280B4311|nr:fimbrillin family protein [uncultured Bacteroides sp.]
MKTNIFKLSFVALAVTAFMASCTQNEEISSVVEGNVTLEVNATVQDFVPDASTRVVDEVDSNNEGNYITKFEEGDEIGVYVFTEDGTMMCKNLPMTYNAEGKWISEAPLYFYKNATYIAYSPYNPEVSSLQIVGSGDVVEAITNYFVGTVMNEPSKTYKDCDLMMASAVTNGELPASGTSAITFSFAHAMSMVEFVIPVKNYKTASGYEYSAPIFGVKLQKQENTGTKVDITPLALGKGVYRTLLAPVAADVMDKDLFFHGELMVGDGTQPVYFTTKNAFKPVAGTFKKVTVTYTDAPSSEVEPRDLQIGDYFYADGGIVPNTEITVPTNNLVGIICQVATEINPIIVGGEQRQARVISVHEAGESADWGNADNEIIPRFIEDETADETNDFAAMISNTDGYSVKVKLEEAGILNSFTACNSAAVYEQVLPEGTTGWYLPTLAELAIAFNNLAGTTLETSSFSNPIVNTTVEQYTAVLDKFRNVGGNIGNGGDTYWLWSCTDKVNANSGNGAAWGLCFNSKETGANNRKIIAGTLWKHGQRNREMKIRPFFAF